MNILVVDQRADEYREHLSGVGHTVRFEMSPPASLNCDILLASPEYAAHLLHSGSRPKWIQSTWAGVDALLPALEKTNTIVTGIKGIFGQLMSEYVFAFILSDLRELKHFAALQDNNEWNDSHLPGSLAGKTLSIVGTGSIGEFIAATAKHFGMFTVGVNQSGKDTPHFDQVGTDLAHALAQGDYVVACLPQTAATNELFDHQAFSAMKREAMFINVGRGNSVSESALTDALTRQQLRCAVLDVFSQEPLPSDSVLWQAPNLTITPHISAPSFTKHIADIFLDNLRRFTNNLPLLYPIDQNKGY